MSIDFQRCFLKVRKNVQLMFIYRKYTNINTQQITICKQKFILICGEYDNTRDNIHTSKKKEYVRCLLFPFNRKKIKSAIGKTDMINIVKYITSADKTLTYHLLFIVDDMSFQCRSYMNNLPYIWEKFTFKSLSFNIMNHIDVPKYQLMTEEEVINLEKKISTKRTDFPELIFNVDPVGKYINARLQDVWKNYS